MRVFHSHQTTLFNASYMKDLFEKDNEDDILSLLRETSWLVG